MLKWARKKYPEKSFGQSATYSAAQAGRLGTLKYLRSLVPPTPWDELAITKRLLKKNWWVCAQKEAILRWMCEDGVAPRVRHTIKKEMGW